MRGVQARVETAITQLSDVTRRTVVRCDDIVEGVVESCGNVVGALVLQEAIHVLLLLL